MRAAKRSKSAVPSEREERDCLRKIRHRAAWVAVERGRILLAQQHEHLPRLWYYKCKFCKGWHFSKSGFPGSIEICVKLTQP